MFDKASVTPPDIGPGPAGLQNVQMDILKERTFRGKQMIGILIFRNIEFIGLMFTEN